MRLLLLTPEFSAFGGGIATFYRPFLQAMSTQGVSIRVVEGSAMATANERNAGLIDGVQTEQLETGRLSAWHQRLGSLSATPILRRHLAAAWAMWEQACEGPDFDIVEATDWGLLFVPPVIAQTHPTVVQAHGSCGQISTHDPILGDEPSEMLMRLIESAVLPKATEIQTSSNSNAAFWQAETGRDIQVLRPAVAAIEATPHTVRPSSRGLVVGRVQCWKGPDTLCEALRLLGREAPQIDWIGREVPWRSRDVAAGDHLAQQYPEIWGTLIAHRPPLPPPEIALRQAAASFNLVPSKWDVFNLTAIEALQSGRPTIVSSGAGASELIEDGRSGFVFQAGEAEGLAQAIKRATDLSPDEQLKMAHAAAMLVKAHFAPDLIANEHESAYRRAISTFSAGTVRVSEWVAQVCSPASNLENESQFLEQFPIRMIADHLAKRLYRRVTR